MRVLAIAQNTFREAVRDRVLYVLLFFAAAAILGSKALGYISIDQDIKVMTSLSLAAVSVFGVLIAIFVGANLVSKEIDKRTIYTIVCCPIHRYEFVLGKYLGLAMLLGVTTLAMTAVAAAYIVALGGSLHLVFFEAALLTYAELLLVTAFSVLLSTLTSPILGAIIVFSGYWIGHATGILVDLPKQFDDTAAKRIMETAYYILPNLGNFDLRAEAANGRPVAAAYVAWTLAYGGVYTTMLLVLAALTFEDKDV